MILGLLCLVGLYVLSVFLEIGDWCRERTRWTIMTKKTRYSNDTIS